VVDPVPLAGDRHRLLGVDPLGVGDVEAQEVDQLAGRVDLRLLDRLRLPEDRRRVERVAVGPASRSAARRKIAARCSKGIAAQSWAAAAGVDRLRDLVGAGEVDLGELEPVVVRGRLHGDVAGQHVLAADDARRLDALRHHGRDAGLERRPFRAAGRVAAHRLVARDRDVEPAVAHRAHLVVAAAWSAAPTIEARGRPWDRRAARPS
jgi:hypothetical protein